MRTRAHVRTRARVLNSFHQIIKNKRAFHEQAQVEIQMLTLFKNYGEATLNHRCIVR